MLDFVFNRAIMILVASVGSFLIYWGWSTHYVEKGKRIAITEIVERSQKQGADNAARAEKRIDNAKRAGAFERLRRDKATCPNCPR